MKFFPMKCRTCGREFECDGHCANLDSLSDKTEKWWKTKDKDKHNETWEAPKNKECTCDNCRNHLIDKNGKDCDNHCEQRKIKVEFT